MAAGQSQWTWKGSITAKREADAAYALHAADMWIIDGGLNGQAEADPCDEGGASHCEFLLCIDNRGSGDWVPQGSGQGNKASYVDRISHKPRAAYTQLGRLTSPACTSVRHNISKHCRLNNKAACTKRSIIDHQKNQTERDCCRKDEHGDSHRQPNFDMYHGQR